MDQASQAHHERRQSPRAAWRRVLTLPGRGPRLMQHETPGQRLARLARWAMDGRRRDAVQALKSWHDAPPLAGQLLAALTRRSRGLLEHMRAPSLLRLVKEQKRRLLDQRRIHHGPGHEARHLADELACRENLLPSLVTALRTDPQPAMVTLLRQAVDHLLARRRQREWTVELCLVKAELALLDSDRETARRWAMRVIHLEAGNAAAAHLLLRTAQNFKQQKKADAALAAALRAHPDYRDLEALARRRLSELDQTSPRTHSKRTRAQVVADLSAALVGGKGSRHLETA